MEKNYRISFKIGQSSFEIESTDLKWLESKEKDYFQRLIGQGPKQMPQAQPTSLPPQITLNEFYQKYVRKIKSRPSTAVFFLYYLQNMRKKETIQTADVTKCFKEIGYPNWNKINMTDALTSAKRRALVNYVNKLWSVTSTGEDYVLNVITGKAK